MFLWVLLYLSPNMTSSTATRDFIGTMGITRIISWTNGSRISQRFKSSYSISFSLPSFLYVQF
eukprot:UN16759